jgi:mannose-6-phosphate isomerase-like protein (cupin superfamily)
LVKEAEMKLITAKESPDPLYDEPTGTVVYTMIGKSYGEEAVTNNHSVSYVVMPKKSGWFRTHYHKVTEETYHVLSGQARVIVDGKEVTVSPGQALLIMPNEVHSLCNDQDTDLEFLAICSPPASPDDHHYDFEASS